MISHLLHRTAAIPEDGVSVEAKSSAYTLTNDDDILLVSGTTTITTHASATATQKPYKIINSGTAIVTVDGNSTETINGVTTVSLAPGAWVDIIPDGTNWVISDSGAPFKSFEAYSGAAEVAWAGTAGNYFSLTSLILDPGTYIVGGDMIVRNDGAVTTTTIFLQLASSSISGTNRSKDLDLTTTATDGKVTGFNHRMKLGPFAVTLTGPEILLLRARADSSVTNLVHTYRLYAWRVR